MDATRIFVCCFYAYLLAGAVFAVIFLRQGAAELDESARGISWKTRALLFPGTVALWPLLWRKWRKPSS